MRRAPRARGVFLPHPADGLRRDPQPHLLAAVRVELRPEPEDPPVGFPGGVARRQGLAARGRSLFAEPTCSGSLAMSD